MAKEIKFNIKLNIDGKEQLVSATSTVENLRGVVNAAKSDIQKANAVFVNFNQQVMKLQNINGAVQQLASTLSSVTEESRTFGAAMNVANTMAGKGGDDFAKLKGQVAELLKTIPYRKTHKRPKGKKRGRKPMRLSARFVPSTLSNEETKVKSLTRCKKQMLKSRDKWTDDQW